MSNEQHDNAIRQNHARAMLYGADRLLMDAHWELSEMGNEDMSQAIWRISQQLAELRNQLPPIVEVRTLFHPDSQAAKAVTHENR
jgi:hypothetical protein